MSTALRGSRPPQNHRCADKAYHPADDIPSIGRLVLDQPEPSQRRSDVDAAVRSVWDCLRPDRPLAWSPILDLRVAATTFTLALGDASYELDRDAWDEADAFLEALVQALRRESLA